MSLVPEHLEQQGAAFEVLAHRQAYMSIEEARALGVDADEVLKTLAVRTGRGYVLSKVARMPSPGGLDQPATKGLDPAASRLVVQLQQLSPALIL